MSDASAHVHTRPRTHGTPRGTPGAPFDALAATYDQTFTERLLGTLLRDAVHEEMSGAFRAGDRVLDLGCGTGEDARRLAERGVVVHGIEQSPEMLALASAKTTDLDVTLEVADIGQGSLPGGIEPFDGVLANFGALNMVSDHLSLAEKLGRVVRPGGRAFLVVMGRWCPWEWIWYGIRGRFATALRRVRGSAASPAGAVVYPSAAELAAAFDDHFDLVRTAGIGVLLPPTYASDLVARHQTAFRRAARLERRIRHGRLASTLNDHFLVELRRRDHPSPDLFACPSCRRRLDQQDGGKHLHCMHENIWFERRDGILHLLTANRADTYAQFVAEYDVVRRAEGRGSDAPDYYRALPFRDTTGRFKRDWKIRAASYRTVVRRLVEPLERRNKSLRSLDLGAGCGWLSYRLTQRGHDAFAVDLRTDSRDGLGAHVHYDAPFTPIRADFDRLPFADKTIDLVIYNASFHYSENYVKTLDEALRVLSNGGRIAVVDTPIYKSAFSGSWMVAARERAFVKRYGFASNSLESEHFLTHARLQRLSAESGITWTIHRPRYGFRWLLRPVLARVRRSCEPAQFAVLEGSPRLNIEADLRDARPNAVIRSAGRVFHRVRRLVFDRRTEPHVIEAAGLRLEIASGVFDPLLFRSGAFLAEVARGLDLSDRSVLDLGTGSGICAIVAALWGANVTATDVGSQALMCTARNADRYAVDIDVLKSDLFEALSDRRFDVVLFNPPYFRGRPNDEADSAWRSDDVTDRFAGELRDHLTEGGYALVVLSTDGACPDYLRTFDRSGFRIARVARRRFANETLTVYRLAI